MGDSCARVRVRVLAHHPRDVFFRRNPLMSLDMHSTSPIEPDVYDEVDLQPNWRERVVTVVATSMAVLIVAITAVLMGMT
jgi:hypothetical protein